MTEVAEPAKNNLPADNWFSRHPQPAYFCMIGMMIFFVASFPLHLDILRAFGLLLIGIANFWLAMIARSKGEKFNQIIFFPMSVFWVGLGITAIVYYLTAP